MDMMGFERDERPGEPPASGDRRRVLAAFLQTGNVAMSRTLPDMYSARRVAQAFRNTVRAHFADSVRVCQRGRKVYIERIRN